MLLTEPVSPLERWALDPTLVHLNHGSYGGCLRRVLDVAAAARNRLEAAPMQFLVLDWQTELDRARAAVAAFVRTDAEQLAFVQSSTTGVAIALASATLAAGDEIVTTSHAYAACLYQLERLAATRGVRIVIVPIALPFDVNDFFFANVTNAHLHQFTHLFNFKCVVHNGCMRISETLVSFAQIAVCINL